VFWKIEKKKIIINIHCHAILLLGSSFFNLTHHNGRETNDTLSKQKNMEGS